MPEARHHPSGSNLMRIARTSARGQRRQRHGPVYVAKCQACHGEKGTKPSDALAGALVGGMGRWRREEDRAEEPPVVREPDED